ncbi:hypothetical protein TPHA_0P01110 [Tetrapisispora phaffii CBS 4417]|uniref:Uncharacterized protein n=1 Tax=Tetrapisispora phaffii (strain ATCC 24235 / CBS 4417 / NBRC 1672 / NRRL Y-8282 / UCD 70-5) TaxID=1071381 RepID=G8C291_TETPH|nr:hypothetical protein TPHA_0P01110 [Tetrapisispora phaffii CBS 4417]CCE66269.1 hypothetical protein TPHA_0P01110 [Tetrapisispora phaffii CBS 4417]
MDISNEVTAIEDELNEKEHDLGFGGKNKSFRYPDFVCSHNSQRLYIDGSSKFGFVHYFMNNVKIVVKDEISECPDLKSFQIFKDCFFVNQNSNLEKYFDIEVLNKENHKIDDNEGTSMLSDITMTQFNFPDLTNEKPTHVQLFPKVINIRYSSGKKNILRLLINHLNCLKSLFEKKNKQIVANLFLDVKRILQSYVEIVIKDVVIKWMQWLIIIQNKDLTKRSSYRILCKRINSLFWRRYFCMRSSSTDSITSFSNRLHRNFREQNVKERSIIFAVWWDEVNDILLFNNGISMQTSDKSKEENIVVASLGLILEDTDKNQEPENKLLLFVNMAIMECLKQELNRY